MSEQKVDLEELTVLNERIAKLEQRTATMQWALIVYVVVASLLVLIFDL